jgi:hypothetical protein
MPPLLAPLEPSGPSAGGKPAVAVPSPMFVVPWWPQQAQGGKADPSKPAQPFPMMMGFPGGAQGMPMTMVPPQFMGFPPFAPPVAPGEQSSQADVDNDVPTHAPCA